MACHKWYVVVVDITSSNFDGIYSLNYNRTTTEKPNQKSSRLLNGNGIPVGNMCLVKLDRQQRQDHVLSGAHICNFVPMMLDCT